MSLPTACSCSVSVPRLCLSTVCHFCAHVRLRIVLYLRAWLSAPTTWLSLPSRFRNRSWQGWGKQIMKKHCCPPQGKIRTASPYGVSSACQSGLPWCYLQLFLLSPIPPRVMCGQLLNTSDGHCLSSGLRISKPDNSCMWGVKQYWRNMTLWKIFKNFYFSISYTAFVHRYFHLCEDTHRPLS